MKNLKLNSEYKYKFSGIVFLLLPLALFNNTPLFAAQKNHSNEQQPVTIKSQSFSLDLSNESAQFSKDIEIISGPVKINAATLNKKKSSLKNGLKIVEVMQLSGTPVKIIIQEKSKNQYTTLFAHKVKFIPSEGILEIRQDAKLSIHVGQVKKTHIEADQINILLKDNLIISIAASGQPLKYQLQPQTGEKISSTAKRLTINKLTEQVNLYQAEVKQGGDKFQAGEIIVDGKTGNFSANAGNSQTPSISIDLDKLKASTAPVKTRVDLKNRLKLPVSIKEKNKPTDKQEQLPETNPIQGKK